MSLAFSSTGSTGATAKKGIIQQIESHCGFRDGDISGSVSLLAKFTAKVNIALDRAYSIIFEVGGTWQFDDSNHTDYPIISRNIVSGQRDYAFTVDDNSTLILDIQKVFVADENGNFREITPVDIPAGAPSNHWDGLNTTGQPNTYEKNANGIFLDPIPNYNEPLGLKLYISREGSYFSTADTTKMPGFAGLFHEYLALHASYEYCRDKGMKNAKTIKADMLEMEEAIMNYYKAREKDVNKVVVPVRNRAR